MVHSHLVSFGPPPNTYLLLGESSFHYLSFISPIYRLDGESVVSFLRSPSYPRQRNDNHRRDKLSFLNDQTIHPSPLLRWRLHSTNLRRHPFDIPSFLIRLICRRSISFPKQSTPETDHHCCQICIRDVGILRAEAWLHQNAYQEKEEHYPCADSLFQDAKMQKPWLQPFGLFEITKMVFDEMPKTIYI